MRNARRTAIVVAVSGASALDRWIGGDRAGAIRAAPPPASRGA
jgi:hypothetical protein